MTEATALPVASLYQACDPEQFSFATTAELPLLSGMIGQQRAIEAVQFGIGIKQQGFNLFVLGPPGIGKYTMVRQYLEQQAQSLAAPPDWCYVNNFAQPHKPIMLRLPSGRGVEFKQDMERLLDDLLAAIPLAYETEEYQSRVQEVERVFKQQREQAFAEISRQADENEIAFVRTPDGFAFVARKHGKTLEPDDFNKLPEAERQHIEAVIQELRDKLGNIFLRLAQWQREMREKIWDINRDVGLLAVGHLIEDLKNKYTGHSRLHAYLDSVQQDVIGHLAEFIDHENSGSAGQMEGGLAGDFRRYQVNVLVDHSANHGAPVIYEDSPIQPKLVGRIEYQSHMGALVTDFMMIKPGALHCANGGYLILDVRKLLQQPYAWEALKRALYAREIHIESLGQAYGLISTVSVEAEPIPLDVKVVLLGERMLYYLLLEYDPDFAELFKVEADFEESMERTQQNHQLYAQMIATLVSKDELLPFDRQAVARIIEHSARVVSDAERLTTHMLHVTDLLRESDHWAREQQLGQVSAEHVDLAISRQIQRADRLRQRLLEDVARGILLLDTTGEVVGQINGLFVVDLGNYRFGHPTRITATTRLGEGEVIDIEREVELGGALHSKGVLILSAFIGSRYAADIPLSLSASLVFEQTYGGVEGDSASLAECCALLSSLAGLPITQALAVTGSVNQHGKVQAIGGVNEKIEGFFEVCKLADLTGSQGVITPQANVKHLMLKAELRQAVADKKFNVYTVHHVDEAMELLTGLEAGQADADGRFPEGTINYRVAARLADYASVRQAFAQGPVLEHEAAENDAGHEK